MIQLLKAVLLLTIITYVQCGKYFPPGYSYARFSGPVSGPEHEIIVKDTKGKGHGHTVDYVAKPDYSFSYGVEDPKSKVSQSRKETRNGDAVHGEYSVVEPDGTLRLVKYTADKKNGFQAQVITSGKPIVQEHVPAAAPAHAPAPAPAPAPAHGSAPAVHEEQDGGQEQGHVTHHSHSNHVAPVQSSHSQSHEYDSKNDDSDGDDESSHEAYYHQGRNDDHDNDDEEEYY